MMSARAASAVWKPVGTVDHRADLIVESLVASVAQFQVDRGGDAG
jgi:hypothetical protein